MAHLEKRTDEDVAYHCLLAAAEKYALSLFYSANNPQVRAASGQVAMSALVPVFALQSNSWPLCLLLNRKAGALFIGAVIVPVAAVQSNSWPLCLLLYIKQVHR